MTTGKTPWKGTKLLDSSTFLTTLVSGYILLQLYPHRLDGFGKLRIAMRLWLFVMRNVQVRDPVRIHTAGAETGQYAGEYPPGFVAAPIGLSTS